VLVVPLAADSVGPPRLVYGSLNLHSPGGVDQAYTALYFEVARSADLGRVTFEGLDAVDLTWLKLVRTSASAVDRVERVAELGG
jgi:hypothetical protein